MQVTGQNQTPIPQKVQYNSSYNCGNTYPAFGENPPQAPVTQPQGPVTPAQDPNAVQTNPGQVCQVPSSASGVNIQIFNPSVGTPGSSGPTYNVNNPCYPSNYYTNQFGPQASGLSNMKNGVNQNNNPYLPGGMLDPANPSNPYGADPNNPNNPYRPGGAFDPTNPNNPYKVKNNESENPYAQGGKLDPNNPNNPYGADPNNPNNPYRPGGPFDPTNTNSPYKTGVNTSDPNNPANPYRPGGPLDPNNPNNPYGANPNDPNNPYRPGGLYDPTNPNSPYAKTDITSDPNNPANPYRPGGPLDPNDKNNPYGANPNDPNNPYRPGGAFDPTNPTNPYGAGGLLNPNNPISPYYDASQHSQSNSENKKTEKKHIIELNDNYIMSLENALNSQDKKVRLNGAKEVFERLDEDPSRKDDKALTALVNKMLQDPSDEVKLIALSALDGRICNGDDLTIKLLQQIENSNGGFGLDASDAHRILLRMAGKEVEKEVPIDPMKRTKVKTEEKDDKKAKEKE